MVMNRAQEWLFIGLLAIVAPLELLLFVAGGFHREPALLRLLRRKDEGWRKTDR